MPERPNAVILYGDGDTRDNYKNLIGGLEDMGVNVLHLNMDWRVDYQNPNKFGSRYWAKQVHEQVGDKPVNILIGHSYGALTVFQYAADLVESGKPPEQIVFLSRSACAAEDLEGDEKDDKAVKKYMDKYDGEIPAGLLAVKIRPLAARIRKGVKSDQISVLVGEREPSTMQRAAKKTAELFGISEPIVVEESDHDMDQYPIYVARTLQEVKRRL